MEPEFKTAKSAETYRRVMAAAVDLFCEVGYEKTTMRAIAAAAPLGLGALYYYFPSKEAIVLAFYADLNRQLADEFQGEGSLPEQVALLLDRKLSMLRPYRDFLKVILKEAVDPDSPLNPLSSSSARTLDTSLGVFQKMVASQGDMPADELERVARLLWLGHLGVLAYWLHTDDDKALEATRLYAELTGLLGLTWLSPELSELRQRVFGLLEPLFSPR